MSFSGGLGASIPLAERLMGCIVASAFQFGVGCSVVSAEATSYYTDAGGAERFEGGIDT